MPTKSKSVLKQLKIISNKNKASNIFEKYISDDFRTISYKNPSEYVRFCYDKYIAGTGAHNNSINGKIFELIIETCLYRELLIPMFLQAKVTFVPNVVFDVLLYTDEQYPVALSLKTSIRERYKQADLEAVALKYVHRRALNYLVMLGSDETVNLKNKCRQGELLGLNNVIAADSGEFDDLINELKRKKYINPGKVDIITGNIVE